MQSSLKENEKDKCRVLKEKEKKSEFREKNPGSRRCTFTVSRSQNFSLRHEIPDLVVPTLQAAPFSVF